MPTQVMTRGPKRARVLSNREALAVRRANQRRRGRPRNRMVSVPSNKLGFPQSMRATLRYTDPVSFNLNSLDQVFFVNMLANGMFDPQVALGGHQPRGFDDYMRLYGKFTVLSSSISVNFVYEGYDGPTSAASLTGVMLKESSTATDVPALSPVTCGLYKGVQLPGAGTVSEWAEKDKMVWKAMTPHQGGVTVSTRMKTGDFFGKKSLVGAEGYTGTDAADPDEKVYYTIWCGRMSGNNAGEVRIRAYLTIQYDAVFTEPKILRAS